VPQRFDQAVVGEASFEWATCPSVHHFHRGMATSLALALVPCHNLHHPELPDPCRRSLAVQEVDCDPGILLREVLLMLVLEAALRCRFHCHSSGHRSLP